MMIRPPKAGPAANLNSPLIELKSMTWCDSRVLNSGQGDKHGGTKHIRHGHDKHSGTIPKTSYVLYENSSIPLVNKLKTIL
jgi:hypothetical protein